MINFSFSFGRNRQSHYVERDVNGGFFYSINNAFKSLFNRGLTDAEKYEAIKSNLGVAFVFDFIAKNYSQQKINEWQNDKLKEKNVLYSILERPNQWQTWTDFLYEYCYWLLYGNVYIYQTKDFIYCLNPNGIQLSNEQLKKFGKLSFSKYGENTLRNIKKGSFKYRDNNGNEYSLELENLHIINDLSGGVTGNYFNSGSRLDALHQVVKNLDLQLKAQYINTEFTGKFLVSGQNDPSDTSFAGTLNFSEAEQQSLNSDLRGNKQVIGVKSKVAIDRFVSDLSSLKLDESIINSIHLIGMMYGLNKDVISNSLKGSTYENKEKSFGAFVDYTLTPISRQMCDLFEMLFDKQDLRGSWEDMPFNQVFQSEKVANDKIKLENLKIAQELGLNENEVQNQLNAIYGS